MNNWTRFEAIIKFLKDNTGGFAFETHGELVFLNMYVVTPTGAKIKGQQALSIQIADTFVPGSYLLSAMEDLAEEIDLEMIVENQNAAD